MKVENVWGEGNEKRTGVKGKVDWLLSLGHCELTDAGVQKQGRGLSIAPFSNPAPLLKPDHPAVKPYAYYRFHIYTFIHKSLQC